MYYAIKIGQSYLLGNETELPIVTRWVYKWKWKSRTKVKAEEWKWEVNVEKTL